MGSGCVLESLQQKAQSWIVYSVQLMLAKRSVLHQGFDVRLLVLYVHLKYGFAQHWSWCLMCWFCYRADLSCRENMRLLFCGLRY